MASRKRKNRNNDPHAPEFRAHLRYARSAPRKAGLVMEQIRDRPVSVALDQLRHMEQKAAALVDKLLKSAIANADRAIEDGLVRSRDGVVIEPQPDVDVDDLYVHEAVADEGPMQKRWRPRARGAAYPYRKYTSNLTIRLRPLPGQGG